MYSEELKSCACSLRESGRTYGQIGNIIGVSDMTVRKWCMRSGISERMHLDPKRKDEIIEQCKKLRAEGKLYKEIESIVGVSKTVIEQACKDMPVRDYSELAINRNRLREKCNKDTVKFLEVRGYTNIHRIDDTQYFSCVCVKCGKESTFFHPTYNKDCKYSCPHCERRKRDELRDLKKEIESRICGIIREKERDERRKQREREAAERKRERIEARKHPCPVCGKETTNRVYCSPKCAKRVENHQRYVKRYAKVKNAIKDKGITLNKLVIRDKGICHICGKPCDYADYRIENGAFIAGYDYPSIDHVVPLSMGGLHSWDNVKLAHLLCNSIKSNKV